MLGDIKTLIDWGRQLGGWLKKCRLKGKRQRERKMFEQRLKGKKTITFESTDGRWCLFDIATNDAKKRFIEKFMNALKKGERNDN